jgi:site-specific DNA-adenine methylase
MKKNHFFIAYAGNKRTEVERIYNSIKDKLNDIEYIVEPFCGTSAFSYYMSLRHPKQFKYILNDNNNYLIELYKTAQDDNKFNELILEINNKIIDIDKEKYITIINQPCLSSYIIKNSFYAIRPGLFPLRDSQRMRTDYNYLKDTPIVNFLKTEDITFYSDNAINIFETYKDNNKALIFLDPPYVQLNNDFYLDSSTNIYEYLCNNNIKNMRSLIILVLEDNWIIRLLFRQHTFITYDKLYQTSKKQTKHLIINNSKTI